MVGEMDDPVGRVRACAQAVEIVQASAEHLCPERGDRRRRGVGTSETEHLVSGSEQLADGGRPDPAGCRGDEDAQENLPVMSLDDITLLRDVIPCHH
jgi:hypothetical protein